MRFLICIHCPHVPYVGVVADPPHFHVGHMGQTLLTMVLDRKVCNLELNEDQQHTSWFVVDER